MTTEPELPEGAGWFDQEVDAYERSRPTYPDELFNEIEAYLLAGGLKPRFEALEIGPGTGKATESLLGRGFRVTAVEHGAAMSSFLHAKFASNDRFDVVHSRFEDAQLANARFDLVCSATAFHWVDPDLRLVKSHQLLRDHGAIAIIDTDQVISEADRGFFERCLPIYRRYRPDEKHHALGKKEHHIPYAYDDIADSSLFDEVSLFRYRQDSRCSSVEYADLVRSYRRTQMQPREECERMIAELSELIDAEFEGYVVRPLMFTLVLGRRG